MIFYVIHNFFVLYLFIFTKKCGMPLKNDCGSNPFADNTQEVFRHAMEDTRKKINSIAINHFENMQHETKKTP